MRTGHLSLAAAFLFFAAMPGLAGAPDPAGVRLSSSSLTYDEADMPASRSWTIDGVIRDIQAGSVSREFRRFFDRNPDRRSPSEPGVIVSPADGLAEVLEEGDRLSVVIHLRLTDVHVQRVPLSGVVKDVRREGDGYFNPGDPRYFRGVRTVTTIGSAIGDYSVEQITSLLARRIRTYVKPGDRVRAGDKLGRILLGSTVVLHLPRNVNIQIKPFQKVYGGETVLARLPGAQAKP